MPKLWRAPMPMVRIAAPQITEIQKLRCGGARGAADEGRGVARGWRLRAGVATADRQTPRSRAPQARRRRITNHVDRWIGQDDRGLDLPIGDAPIGLELRGLLRGRGQREAVALIETDRPVGGG